MPCPRPAPEAGGAPLQEAGKESKPYADSGSSALGGAGSSIKTLKTSSRQVLASPGEMIRTSRCCSRGPENHRARPSQETLSPPAGAGPGRGLGQRNTRPTSTAPALAQLSSHACSPFRRKTSQTRTEPPSGPPGPSTPPPAWGRPGAQQGLHSRFKSRGKCFSFNSFSRKLHTLSGVDSLTPCRLSNSSRAGQCRRSLGPRGRGHAGRRVSGPPGGVTTRALPLPRASPTAAGYTLPRPASPTSGFSACLTSKASPFKMCCS